MDEATREAIYAAMKPFDTDRERTSLANYENYRFRSEHLEEWRKDHAEQWIATYGSKLITVDPGIGRLLAVVEQSCIPRGDIYIQFLRREQPLLML